MLNSFECGRLLSLYAQMVRLFSNLFVENKPVTTVESIDPMKRICLVYEINGEMTGGIMA